MTYMQPTSSLMWSVLGVLGNITVHRISLERFTSWPLIDCNNKKKKKREAVKPTAFKIWKRTYVKGEATIWLVTKANLLHGNVPHVSSSFCLLLCCLPGLHCVCGIHCVCGLHCVCSLWCMLELLWFSCSTFRATCHRSQGPTHLPATLESKLLW